jgi:hypothetical protein
MLPAQAGGYMQRVWGIFSAAMFLMAAHAAAAEPLTYTNERFGTSATFPAEIFTDQQEPPANGDGLSWHSADGASLAIFGSYNILDETPESRETEAKASSERKLTYRKTGKDWVVLSGIDGDLIFYERYMFGRSGTIHGVVLKYPQSLTAKYDTWVGKITASLKGP